MLFESLFLLLNGVITQASPRRRNEKRQNDFCQKDLRRPYEYLRKEEKQKAKEKRKDTSIGMQSYKE